MINKCLLHVAVEPVNVHTSIYYMQVPSSQMIDPSREEADVRLWHDQLFAKPAKHGGVVAWYSNSTSMLDR